MMSTTIIEIIRKDFIHELNDIRFTATPEEAFRAKITSASGGLGLWLENKKTKEQWEAALKNVANAGNNGALPEDVVVESLRRALAMLTPSYNGVGDEQDTPSVTLGIANGGAAVLALHLSLMGGIWKNTLTFTLLPVKLEKVDILEAKLRDAEEQITSLNARLEAVASPPPFYLSISSATLTGANSVVVWGGHAPNLVASSHFSLSTDKRKVTILRDGHYQISVRVAGCNSADGESLGLQLNGKDIAVCYQSESKDHQNTAHIFEILPLKEDDALQVRCGFCSSSLKDRKANRFTILFLGN